MQRHGSNDVNHKPAPLEDASISVICVYGVLRRTVKEPLDAIGSIDDGHIDGIADDHLGRPHQHHLTDLPKHNT